MGRKDRAAMETSHGTTLAAKPAPASRAPSLAHSAWICGCSCAVLRAWPKTGPWCSCPTAPVLGPMFTAPRGSSRFVFAKFCLVKP